jgi:hypothetical protein
VVKVLLYLASLDCSDPCIHASHAHALTLSFISSKLQNHSSTDVASLSAAANYWYSLAPIIWRDEDVRQLYDLISSSERRPPNDTHVVTVLGRPNIGKDAVDVVSKVCSQLVLSSNWSIPSFELYGWVNVSNSNPFDVRGLSRWLLSVLRPKSSPYSRDPVGECSRLLSERRCLVVINGLKRTEDCSELERAGLIYKHPNSCIVVVTTEESVATYWTTEATPAAVHNKKPIAHESSLSGQQVCLL